MVFGDNTSAWWFLGKLQPTVATRFNVQQREVQPGVYVELLHDMIAMWARPGPFTIAGLHEVREMFGLITGAYALITRIALDYSIEAWVEAKKTPVGETMIGTIVDPRGHDPDLSEDGPHNVDMLRAVDLAIDVRDMPGYRLALLDIHTAFSNIGDDALVFAYRAVEDVARVPSMRLGDLRPSDWAALHDHLGTTRELFFNRHVQGLFNAAGSVGHGDDVEIAPEERHRLIEIGRIVVAETMACDTVTLSLSDLRDVDPESRVPRSTAAQESLGEIPPTDRRE